MVLTYTYPDTATGCTSLPSVHASIPVSVSLCGTDTGMQYTAAKQRCYSNCKHDYSMLVQRYCTSILYVLLGTYVPSSTCLLVVHYKQVVLVQYDTASTDACSVSAGSGILHGYCSVRTRTYACTYQAVDTSSACCCTACT